MPPGISEPNWIGLRSTIWNTDNPHIHVLIRGRAEDGQDLVISRDYISLGFRDRAAERVSLELGPRSEREIRSATETEVGRRLDEPRALRVAADEGAGVADLRPSASGEDPELRRLLLGRPAGLERLGLVEQIAPGCWTLKPGIEDKLRDHSLRSDIIKTMHRAMGGVNREPDVSVLPCTVTRRWMRYSAASSSVDA
jgi:type IV secretory pathway VirD2 relaxase